MAPRYQAEARLAISARGQPNPFSDPTRDTSSNDLAVRMDKEAINTHVNALLSTDLAQRIANELKLAERPEFNSAVGTVDRWSAFWRGWGIGAPRVYETDTDRVLATFFRQLDVYTAKESRTINVRFTSIDAELAAEIANSLVEAYRDDLASKAVGETDQVLESLSPEITKLAGEVAKADSEAQQFRGKANIFAGGQQSTGLNEQQLAELSAELTRTKASRSEAEARMKSARDLLDAGAADVLPDVQKSPLIQNLIQSRVRVERQVAELSATLLPGHPRMQQLNADLAGLKRQISAETQKIVSSIEKEASVAKLRETAIAKSLDDVKAQIVRQSPDEVKLRQLEALAKSKRLELERLQAQFESNKARAASRAISVETQIVTSARASATPVFPQTTATTVAVMVATLLAGLALVLTRGLIAGARQHQPGTSPGDWREGRPEPVIDRPVQVAPAKSSRPPLTPQSAAEKFAAVAERARAVAAQQPQAPAAAPSASSTAEPFSRGLTAASSIIELSRRIEGCLNGKGGLRLMIAGADQSIGVAQEAVNLVNILASRGRSSILIDWCASSTKGCAALVGLPSTAGLAEILKNETTFDQVVRPIPGQKSHILPGGALESTSFEVEHDKLNIILDALDETYDFIAVAGRYDDARLLFETVEGRFDAGVTIGRGASPVAGRYLDFDVFDIDLFHLDATGAARSASADRLKNVLEPPTAEPASI